MVYAYTSVVHVQGFDMNWGQFFRLYCPSVVKSLGCLNVWVFHDGIPMRSPGVGESAGANTEEAFRAATLWQFTANLCNHLNQPPYTCMTLDTVGAPFVPQVCHILFICIHLQTFLQRLQIPV